MIQEIDEIEKYINLCHEKATKHFKNSTNARKWHKTLDFTGSFVAASASLTLPLLAVTNSSSIIVAGVGNSFVFVGVILSTLQKVYGFNTLEIIHGHLSSEYSDLESEFRNLNRRRSNIEYGNHGDDDLEKLIVKFQGISSKSNIQNVKDCHLYFCCYQV